MNSVSTHTVTELKTTPFWNHVPEFFGEDWRFLKLIFTAVTLWLGLAQLCAFLIPDTTTTLANNSSQYLDYVLRNVQIYILVVFAIGMFKFLKASDATEKGKSALPYIRKSIAKNIREDKKQFLAHPIYFVIAMAVFALYLFSYSTIKTRIPNIIPYMWDETFRDIDRTLFLGRDPWQWFSFLYDHPKLIGFMDTVYDFWAGILVSVWFFVLRYGGQNKARRYQFVLALLLVWFVGGNVLAILSSSGGPVYFETLTGLSSTYSDQLARLSEINAVTPLSSFEYQSMLWRVYESPSVGLGGISAMPSMHCASSLLLLFMFGRNKVARLALLAFCALIFISSFMLAWHYAVDGIFVLPVTYACWKLAEKLVEMVSEKTIKIATA